MTDRTSSIEWSFRADDALDALRMRQVVRSFLEAESDPTNSDLDGAVLVFGELVGNVVRHAPGQIGVRIEWLDNAPPTLTVEDRGPGVREVPNRPPDHDPWRESGRGFEIVRAIGSHFRVTPRPLGGSRIEVTLPVERRASAEHERPH